LELLCDLFLPVVQSQTVEEHDTWQHAFADIDSSVVTKYNAVNYFFLLTAILPDEPDSDSPFGSYSAFSGTEWCFIGGMF